MTVRNMTEGDLDAAFQINELGIDVDLVDRATLARLFKRSLIALAVTGPSSDMVGFCMITDTRAGELPPRAAWAIGHDGAVLHVERLAFLPEGSGHGLGVDLFDEIDERVGKWARAAGTESTPLTSIIKVEPLNEHGRTFHQIRGFHEIDRQAFGDTTWGLMQKCYDG